MNNRSDGSTASYYELPANATELQHLISHRDMNAQIGEIFRACYRYGIASHSDRLRDAKKIKFYIDAEIARLEAGELSRFGFEIRHPMTPNVVQWPESEARMDVIGQNGNDGAAYRCSECTAEHCACVSK